MKRLLSILLASALILAAGLSFAETVPVRPLELADGSFDPGNGEFWVEMDPDDNPGGGSLTLSLYLEGRYSQEAIQNLRQGDTVEVDGQIYTVELVLIHGWYDSDGDGENDTGSVTVKDPEAVRELLEKHKIKISEYELDPFSYEIYTQEEFDGYIAFNVGDDGFCHLVVNDMTYRTLIGMVEIPLPLPEWFVCHINDEFGDGDIQDGTAQDFLDALEYGCDRYNDTVRFEDGQLVEAWINRW